MKATDRTAVLLAEVAELRKQVTTLIEVVRDLAKRPVYQYYPYYPYYPYTINTPYVSTAQPPRPYTVTLTS